MKIKTQAQQPSLSSNERSSGLKPYQSRIFNRAGQAVIEYVLLLVVVSSLGAIIIRDLVSRGDEPGILVQKWDDILNTIAHDNPEE